jgi:hypothetical protein
MATISFSGYTVRFPTKRAKSILDTIQTRANLRNRVLYSSSQGIPSVTTVTATPDCAGQGRSGCAT